MLTFVGMWQWTPFHTLIYQGGARAIPEVLYQAAAIDGAGRVRMFFHITLPQLRNTMITSIVLMVVGGLTTFDTILILTQGHPGISTTSTSYYMYMKGFAEFQFGAGERDRRSARRRHDDDLADHRPRLRVGQDAQHAGGHVTARRPNYVAGVLTSLLARDRAGARVRAGQGVASDPSRLRLVRAAVDSDARHHLQLLATVFHSGFLQVLREHGDHHRRRSSLIVVVLVPPVAFAIVRNRSRTVTLVFRVFLLGLAVPIQAVIVPLYFLITKAGLYDTLLAVILPTAAFSMPISTIIMTGSMRDITGDLYEAMALDGASSWRTFRNLVLPLARGGLATIIVFSALQRVERLPAPADPDAVGQRAGLHAGPVRLPDRQLDRRAGHLRRRGSVDHPDSGRVPVCPPRSDPGPDGRRREVTRRHFTARALTNDT